MYYGDRDHKRKESRRDEEGGKTWQESRLSPPRPPKSTKSHIRAIRGEADPRATSTAAGALSPGSVSLIL